MIGGRRELEKRLKSKNSLRIANSVSIFQEGLHPNKLRVIRLISLIRELGSELIRCSVMSLLSLLLLTKQSKDNNAKHKDVSTNNKLAECSR